MPATRKINKEVQEDDLNQMKNLFSSKSSTQESTPSNEEAVATQAVYSAVKEESKNVTDTKIGVRLTTAKKNELKAYFISHGVTVSQGIIDAYELLRKFETEGKVAYKDGILNIRQS